MEHNIRKEARWRQHISERKLQGLIRTAERVRARQTGEPEQPYTSTALETVKIPLLQDHQDPSTPDHPAETELASTAVTTTSPQVLPLHQNSQKLQPNPSPSSITSSFLTP